MKNVICVIVTCAVSLTSATASAQQTEADGRSVLSGRGFQNQKLFEDAIDEWQTFLRKFPSDARAGKAQHYLGTCCLQEKRYPEAITAFNEVVRKYPKFDLLDQSTLNLGISWYGQAQKSSKESDFASAEKVFAGVLTRFPSSKYLPRALYYRGECLFQLKQTEQAAAAYNEFIRRFPNDELHADALYGLGTALEDSNKKADAADAFAAFVSSYPKHPLTTEVRMRQTDILFEASQFKRASSVFEAVSKNKDFELADVAMLRHARCLYEAGDLDESARLYWNVPREFRKTKHYDAAILAGAKCYYLNKKYSLARSGLEKIIDRSAPESMEATQWLARCYLKEGSPEKALKIADKGLRRIKDRAARTELELVRIDAKYEMPRERKQAAGLYAEFARRNPKHELAAQAQYMAALSAIDLKKYDTAKQQADTFLARYRNSDLTPDVLFISAESELLLGKHQAAIGRYEDFLKSAPSHANAAQAKVRLALAMVMADQPASATRLLEPIAARLPTNELRAEAFGILGRAYAAQKQYGAATDMLKKAIASESDPTRREESRIALAEAFREMGRDDDADIQLAQLLKDSPGGSFAAEANFRLAESAYAAENYSKAIQYYTTSIRSDSKGEFAPHALYGLGWTQFNLGEFEKAAEATTSLISKHRSKKIAARGLYLRAMAAYQLEEYSSVLRDIDAFLKTRPESKDQWDALYVKGLAQRSMGELKAAASTYEAILNKARNYEAGDKVAYELGWTFMELKRTADAVETFDRLASTWPKSPLAAEGLFLVGEAYYDAEKFEQAAAAYAKSSISDGSPEIEEKSFHKLGWSQLKAKNTDAAIAAFNQQLTKFPQGELAADANFLIGECSFNKKDWDQARKAFELVARNQQSNYVALAMFRAGECAASQEDWQASGTWHRKVLQNFPNFEMTPEARYGYAWAIQNEGRTAEAIPLFEQVTEETQSETAAKARFMIGECLFAEKKHKEATRHFLKAAFTYNHKQWSAMAYFEAARCFEVLRDTEQAANCYENLITKYPQHSKVRDAKRRLSDLNRS